MHTCSPLDGGSTKLWRLDSSQRSAKTVHAHEKSALKSSFALEAMLGESTDLPMGVRTALTITGWRAGSALKKLIARLA